jgi:hypothetical protein
MDVEVMTVNSNLNSILPRSMIKLQGTQHGEGEWLFREIV